MLLVYGLVVAVLTLGLWALTRTGNPAKKDGQEKPKNRRRELLDARAHIRRQIEILEAPAGRNIQDAPPPSGEALAELQQVLTDIEKELRALPGGWRGP